MPSPEDTLLVVQWARSIPDPPASVQLHVTVTSVLLHPAVLLGDCTGLATGAIVSVTVSLLIVGGRVVYRCCRPVTP